MHSIRRRQIIKNTFIIGLSLAVACFVYFNYIHKQLVTKDNLVGYHPPVKLSGWLVDWAFEESIEDALAIDNTYASYQLFYGYFDEQDRIIWGEKQQQLVSDTIHSFSSTNSENDSTHPPLYLTIVNDIKHADGSSTQKDTQLVNRLISSLEAQYELAEQLVTIAQENGLAGIEIDFEQINTINADQLATFFEFLYTRFSDADLKLRIVLEPKYPIETTHLPVGPEYVVMAYNLYGLHSGPGPKADIHFIGKLTARMENLPSSAGVAIATGGFKWSEDGRVESLSELKSAELKQQASADSIVRDEDSHAISFNGIDEQGNSYSVWYADTETIKYWIEAVQQRGYSNISIWRMGGLTEETITMLNELNN